MTQVPSPSVPPAPCAPFGWHGAAGLQAEFASHGSLRHLRCGDMHVNAFVGSEAEGGPANLWLRRHDGGAHDATAVALLGPGSPLAFRHGAQGLEGLGTWQGLELRLALRLAAARPAWFWHVEVRNAGASPCRVSLLHAQDLGLAPYGAIRTNEYYVSQYIDLAPLRHGQRGWVVAARQNQPAGGRCPWAVIGSLRVGTSYATDALQLLGLSLRAGGAPAALARGLPGSRLQHEHALAAIEDEAVTLAPGASASLGFFGCVQSHHPEASGDADLAVVDAALALPESAPPSWSAGATGTRAAPSLFAQAPMLAAQDLSAAEINAHWPAPRRHEERDAQGALLSFFHGADAHVVLRAKELAVQRPHGHLLRSGDALVPDETALTSTVWMTGVFASMVTQGHVGINRFLSTVRGWLGQFRSQGQRVFVEVEGRWRLLGLPSAFEMRPDACRWLYRHAGGLIEVTARVDGPRHRLDLQLRVLEGAPVALLVTHHVALGGDDGADGGAALWRHDGDAVFLAVPPTGDLSSRFPGGGFRLMPGRGQRFERVGGDELLYADGMARGEPFVCIGSAATREFSLSIEGALLPPAALPTPERPLAAPRWQAADAAAAQLGEIVPWFQHDALIHCLAPRGLEQFTGGGWGTRDVCQGPLEMLLALGHTAPVRDLLQRVFAAQNADGDWPQWFMFFERERGIRAGDSHGDIVYWPLLGLARYLLATDDAALLDEVLPFFDAPAASLWQHVERARAVIDARRIPGTQLPAYGHGDWNDSLQPVDASQREHLCSGWTTTLHHQTLSTLARALARVGRADAAAALQAQADVALADFQRLLLADGVVAGYADFTPGRERRLLLHPQDRVTGVRYSVLAMIHAVIDDMLSPEQARAQLATIDAHLHGPDGVRLFDRPLPYRGGPMTLFQRAESAAFFGREIGVMYMHAHLRFAEMLAHLGEAERFFDALCKAHPVLLHERVATASPRQANCYYSSSDAAFPDRYAAQERYDDIAAGRVALDGGWRVYSSGPGIALALLVERFLGLRHEARTLVVDPVLPARLDGLRADVSMAGVAAEMTLRVGPRGHGVRRVELNGQPLAFERGRNPYRLGAAEVPMERVRAALRAPGGNRLVVELG